MKTVAVIVAYWPDRFPGVAEIVREVLAGTVVPDSVLVINNNPKATLPPIEGSAVINSGANFTSRSKYAIAMLEPAHQYLLLDDDVGVHPEFLEHLLGYATEETCLSDCGGIMVDNFYSNAHVVSGANIDKPVPVDLFHGCVQLCSFRSIVRMLAAEATIRLPNLPFFRSVGEDLLIALANRSFDHSLVVPTHSLCNRTAKPQGTGAMQNDNGYYPFRDYFFHRARVALGARVWDSPAQEWNHLCELYVKTLAERDAGTIGFTNRESDQ